MNNLLQKEKIIENFALLFVSIIIGIIVSGVAQVLIIAAQNFFQLLFLNQSFSLKIHLFGLKLRIFLNLDNGN